MLEELWTEVRDFAQEAVKRTTQEMTLHMDITLMVNTKIRLIILFAAKDGEALTVSKNKTKN